MTNPQESFWAGEFGDAYCDRNFDLHSIATNLRLFSDVLSGIDRPRSIVEFGANVGMNLRALRHLLPEASISAIEINHKASDTLRSWPEGRVEVFEQSILDGIPGRTWDLALIKTVLIHIAPENLPKVYANLHAATGRYLFLAEYFSPDPVEIEYRGHRDRLFKRDFCGELLDLYPDLRLRRYGFSYARDPISPGADVNWFLLEKVGA